MFIPSALLAIGAASEDRCRPSLQPVRALEPLTVPTPFPAPPPPLPVSVPPFSPSRATIKKKKAAPYQCPCSDYDPPNLPIRPAPASSSRSLLRSPLTVAPPLVFSSPCALLGRAPFYLLDPPAWTRSPWARQRSRGRTSVAATWRAGQSAHFRPSPSPSSCVFERLPLCNLY